MLGYYCHPSLHSIIFVLTTRCMQTSLCLFPSALGFACVTTRHTLRIRKYRRVLESIPRTLCCVTQVCDVATAETPYKHSCMVPALPSQHPGYDHVQRSSLHKLRTANTCWRAKLPLHYPNGCLRHESGQVAQLCIKDMHKVGVITVSKSKTWIRRRILPGISIFLWSVLFYPQDQRITS